MDVTQLNQAISKLSPYTDKELRRHLVGQRRKLENQIKQSISDIQSGNLPAMLKVQS